MVGKGLDISEKRGVLVDPHLLRVRLQLGESKSPMKPSVLS
jgi:hypothetical protein